MVLRQACRNRTKMDVKDMQYEKVNAIEDILLFNGEDFELEFCFFPTFYIHNMNECLLLWTGHAVNYMFDINSEICHG